MSRSTSELLRLLPDELRRVAYWWLSEAAWKSEDALLVLEWMRGMGYAAIGIDVWLPSKGGPEIPAPYVYVWDVGERKESEQWGDFVRRTLEEGRAYVLAFRWYVADVKHRSDVPYFNIEMLPPD